MVVGDEDQSIYAFRGSNVHYIRSFPRRYEGAVVYLLGRNYRSTPNVIESANALISQNRERHYKRVWSENEPGRQISMKQWVDPHEEARATAYEIELARAEGWPDEELAILVRTRRQFVPLQVELQKRQIPFHVVGDAPWYARADVRTVLAWMRATINPRDLDAGAEVLKSWDGLGNGAVKAWKDAMESVGDAMFGRIAYLHGLPGLKPGTKRGQRLADFQKAWREWDQPNSKESLRARVEWLFHTLGIVQQIIEAKTSSRPSEVEDGNRREAFLRLVLDIVPDEPESGGWDGMRKWMDDLFTHTTSKNDNKGGVCLSTIHGSKGLEWGCVWLPGWSAGIFPGERAETPEQIEEERRLAYVALTRAKDYLSVSWFDYTQVPRPRACGPCLFIAEMDPENAKGEDWTRSEDPALSDLPPPPACVPTVTYANGWAQERWFVDSFAETVDRATDMDEAEHLWSGWDESVTVLGVRGVEVHPEGDGSLCIACQRMLRVSVSLVLESPSRPKAWTIRLGRRCAARLLNHRGQIFDALRAAKDMGLIREVPIVKGSLFTYSRSESWVWPAKPQTTVERGGGNALFVHHNEPKENE
jgi:hypothetical protein